MSPIWTVVIATAAMLLFSLLAYSLRSFRRAGLYGELEQPRRDRRIALLERQLAALRLTASLLRAMCQIVVVAGILYIFLGRTPQWQWWRILAAVFTAGGVIAIFGIAIPGAWGHYAAGTVVTVSLWPLLALRYALWPIIIVMHSVDLPIRRLAGVSENREDESEAAKQEILQAATEGAAEGNVEHDEVEMIASVIAFGDRQAGAIMTPRTDVFALPVETPWHQACAAVVQAGHTRVPVFERDLDNIIGILYAKDLLKYVAQQAPGDLRGILRRAFFVPESKRLDDLLREFRAKKVHLAVVLDEYGGTAGLVTIEDILEEIVGEIADEYDRAETAAIERTSDTTAELDGKAYVKDVNEIMGLHIPEDADYVTAAGMVFSELGYVPKTGETVEAHGGRFTVLAADERKITRLKVEVLPENLADDQGNG